MKKILVFISFLVLHSSFMFSQEEWDLNRDSDGIKVYSKEIEGYKFKTFKGTAIINGSVHEFISVLSDIENLPDWGYNVTSAELLEQTSETIQIYYSIAKAPFPYKDRDGVYRNSYKWNSDAKTLKVEIEVLDDYLDENDKYIRVKGFGYWKIIVLSEDKMEATFSMQINPGGSIPSWLANMFVDGTPYHTLLNIKEVIESKEGGNLKYDFID